MLRTGDHLNMGTFQGDAQAFILDTLLRLVDVKGTDGKTTLLHFVIQEIMKSEAPCAAQTENPLQCNSMDIPSPSEADDNKSRMTDNVPKIMGVDKYVGQQMKTSMGNMKSPVELPETSFDLPHWRVLQRGLRSQQRLTGLRKWEWESL